MVATLFSPRCSAFGAQRSQQTPSSPGLSPQPASWRQKPRSAARQPQLQEAGVQLPSEPSNPAGSTSPACSCLTVQLHDLSNQLIRYEQAWQLQKDLVEQVCREASTTAPGGSAGAVILLQHHPVYTLGAGSTEGHLRFDPAASPLPLFRTERGGEVTYHGPGQLVMYPILNLRLFRQDLHWYLRSLEEVIIRALAEVSGLKGERIQGLTGVWVGGSKVAAIGVRASRWVTYHGLALNVAMDLTPFQQIVPCGIADRGVTSVEQLLAGLERQAGEAHGGTSEEGSTAAAVGLGMTSVGKGAALATVALGGRERQQLLEEYRHGLLEAFEEVFGVELRPV